MFSEKLKPKKEKDLYEAIKVDFEKRFLNKFKDFSPEEVYLEITFNGSFSEEIKERIPEYRDIIFPFLRKKNSPDITGFVRGRHGTEFITVEVKNDVITLEDIYQAKRYAELFGTKYGFLISTQPIPTEIKRLSKKIPILMTAGTGFGSITLGEFDIEKNEMRREKWFPKSSFEP